MSKRRSISLRWFLVVVASTAAFLGLYGERIRRQMLLMFPNPVIESSLQSLQAKGASVQYISPAADNTKWPFESLSISGPQVTDGDMQNVAALAKLEQITIFNTSITDAGVVELAACREVTYLNLSMNRIGDAAVESLTSIPHLRTLALDWTEVTDESITLFARMPSLRKLHIRDTQITQAGIQRLREIAPHIEVDSRFATSPVRQKID